MGQPGPAFLADRSAKTVHISQYEFHSTQRSSLAHRKPQPDNLTACSCVQPELGSPRPNFIKCQPASQSAGLHGSSRPLEMHLLQAARRERLLRAERQEPRMLGRDLLSTSSLPGAKVAHYQSMYVRFVPFLRVSSTVLCAPPASKQASNKDCGRPASVVPDSWLSLLFCPELIYHG